MDSEFPQSIQKQALVPVTQISRGESLKVERRKMKVTAYTARDKGMDGKGVTASGEPVKEGRTIAADSSFPFGTKIYIPKLEHTYTVTDRGGAIRGNRLDLYMEKRSKAIEFGVWELEVWIEK